MVKCGGLRRPGRRATVDNNVRRGQKKPLSSSRRDECVQHIRGTTDAETSRLRAAAKAQLLQGKAEADARAAAERNCGAAERTRQRRAAEKQQKIDAQRRTREEAESEHILISLKIATRLQEFGENLTSFFRAAKTTSESEVVLSKLKFVQTKLQIANVFNL